MNPPPCPWVADLDNLVSENAQQAVKQIRQVCQCEECKKLREEEHDPV